MWDAWRCIITVHGGQLVMMHGDYTMLVLSADSLVFKMQSVLTTKIVMFAMEVDRFGLTILIVQVMSHRYFHADIEEWGFTTVITVKTRG
jgi:hypothetical protein